MVMSPGFTTKEIREYVQEYENLRHGQKGIWLAEQPFSDKTLFKWRDAIYDGDLERGLVPREGIGMKKTPTERREISEQEELRARASRVTALEARVRELEETNEALGKAIGLLHTLSGQEPDTPPMNELNSSSAPKTTSSEP